MTTITAKINLSEEHTSKHGGEPMEFNKGITASFNGMPIFIPACTLLFGNPKNFGNPIISNANIP